MRCDIKCLAHQVAYYYIIFRSMFWALPAFYAYTRVDWFKLDRELGTKVCPKLSGLDREGGILT